MKLNRALAAVLLSWCFAFTAYSQTALSTETINSGGNNFRNKDMSVDWSIGEMTMIHTVSSPGFIISNGVLQPLKYKTNIKNPLKNDLQLYPTITSGNFVTLAGNFTEKGNLYIIVSNSLGQVLSRQIVPINGASIKQKIEIQTFQKAEYFIKVIFVDEQHTQQYKHTFKLIKS